MKDSHIYDFRLDVDVPERIDKLLSLYLPEYSRSTIQKWISNKDILINGINIKTRSREVWVNKNLINDLTFSEFQILYLLAGHPGWVFTRYQIIDKIRGDNYPVTDRSVDFQIVGLRKKLGDAGKLIKTVRGVGYRFTPDEK